MPNFLILYSYFITLNMKMCFKLSLSEKITLISLIIELETVFSSGHPQTCLNIINITEIE